MKVRPIEEVAETQEDMRETVENLFDNTLDDKKEEVELVEQAPHIDENQIDEAIEESIEELTNEATSEAEEQLTEDTPQEVETVQQEIPEEIKKQFEELETLEMQNATKQDIQDIKNLISDARHDIRHDLAETRKEVANVSILIRTRETEYINYLKMIFERLKFLKGRIGKWFVISSIVLIVAGGATFTTIYHHWDTIEPKINAILGVVKIANNVSKVGG